MRVFATLPQEDLRKVGAAAKAIEADGYDGVVSMENKHDPFLALAVAGAQTERIELHTGVAIAFARTPMAVANVGWDLAGSTGGRFVIGLGSQVRAHNERRFGGLVDALTLRGDGAGEVPPDLIQHIRRLPHTFREFARPD